MTDKPSEETEPSKPQFSLSPSQWGLLGGMIVGSSLGTTFGITFRSFWGEDTDKGNLAFVLGMTLGPAIGAVLGYAFVRLSPSTDEDPEE